MTSNSKRPSREKVQTSLDEAINHKKAGRYEEAIDLIRPLLDSFPRSAKLHCALAGVYWEKDDIDCAEESFLQAIKHQPDFELASRGLFHVLWDAGRSDEAQAEMRRFLAIAESEDYKAIAAELDQKTARRAKR